ncbi:lipoprotein [Caenimonas terrae]|uniref:Lipoprotein n=1 Tax=Caenimonas terrae TaxID=696074 RepID=A0ABW0NM56_9BURK
MLKVCRILVSAPLRRLALAAIVVAPLVACGQKGPLFIPTDPAAQNRATLTESVRPAAATPPASPASAPPATGTASPLPVPQ